MTVSMINNVTCEVISGQLTCRSLRPQERNLFLCNDINSRFLILIQSFYILNL